MQKICFVYWEKKNEATFTIGIGKKQCSELTEREKKTLQEMYFIKQQRFLTCKHADKFTNFFQRKPSSMSLADACALNTDIVMLQQENKSYHQETTQNEQ